MLYFITMSDNKFTIELFLDVAKQKLGFPAGIISYEEAATVDSFRNSLVIFCDIERFTEDSIGKAYALYDRISLEKPRRILNNPYLVLRRFELLTELYRRNINSFNVYRSPFPYDTITYPVFVRNELDHYGPVSDLLYSETELVHTLKTAKGRLPGAFLPLVVEFCDVRTGSPGFHKYGAFYLWNTVVPRHLFFSDKWMVKGTREQLPDHIGLEKFYLAHNSFQREIAAVFRIAQIEYGRVDFARTQNGLAIFEINTNPTILDSGDLESNRQYATESFVSAFTDVLRNLYHNNSYPGVL